MPELVEYCVGNVDGETRDRLRDLDCRTVEKPCLQRCGACFEGALLVVDGEPIEGTDHCELLPGVGE